MRCVRERAAAVGVELPPLPEPASGRLAAGPSRRGIVASGRSFTSLSARQPAPAGGEDGEPPPQQPASSVVLTPAVAQLQPPPELSPAGAGSRGKLPSRPQSRRALLSPREAAGALARPASEDLRLQGLKIDAAGDRQSAPEAGTDGDAAEVGDDALRQPGGRCQPGRGRASHA